MMMIPTEVKTNPIKIKTFMLYPLNSFFQLETNFIVHRNDRAGRFTFARAHVFLYTFFIFLYT